MKKKKWPDFDYSKADFGWTSLEIKEEDNEIKIKKLGTVWGWIKRNEEDKRVNPRHGGSP